MASETMEQAVERLAAQFDFECTESDDHDFPAATCPKCLRLREMAAAKLHAAYCSAQQAERERCANIAESDPDDAHGHAIAAAIRKGEK